MRPEPCALAAALLLWTPHARAGASGAVAVSPDGKTVAAVNPDSGSVSFVDARTLELRGEVAVGKDPRALAFTPDSRRLVVAARGSSEAAVLSVDGLERMWSLPLGPGPSAVVCDGERAYVAESALGDVAELDLTRRRVVRRIRVGADPAGLAVKPGTWGRAATLYVSHLLSGRVTSVSLSSPSALVIALTTPDSGLAHSIALSRDGRRAYLPQTRFNAENPALAFDTTVFPVVHVLDLDAMRTVPAERIHLGLGSRPVNRPFAAALSPDGARLYVANAGSGDLSVVDLRAGKEVAQVPLGAEPRGVAVSPDATRVFANNVLDGTLSVVDARELKVLRVVRLTALALPPQLLLGKKLFNSAADPRLSLNRWISCATCHPDGGADGRTWVGFPDGPRNTPELFGAARTAPFHWSGDLDELHDVELTIRGIQAGTGLAEKGLLDSLGPPHAGRSRELDALAAYVASLEVEPSPHVLEPPALERGRAIFLAQGCALCHPAPRFTDRGLHDVGTGDKSREKNSHGRGTRFDTPSLVGVWRSAPYFHDGSAASLEEALRSRPPHDVLGGLADDERRLLLGYLRSLPER